MNFIEIPNCIHVRNDRLVFRKAFEDISFRRSKSDAQLANEKNLENNLPKGHVNRKIRMNINRIVTNWLEAVKIKNTTVSKTLQQYFTFVTLTLPSTQIHEDKDVYKLLLNPFLKTLVRKYNVWNYLWRAERQGNGNIHYHLIVDRFIYWKELRSIWNNLLQANCYIDNYRIEQENWHKEGFRVRENLLENWSLESQYKAYKEGIESNWSNPNTTDIHKLKNIKNPAKYITKYVGKSDLIDSYEKLKKSLNDGVIEQLEFDYMERKIMSEIEATKINGRVWGCSDRLRDLKDFKEIECVEVIQLMAQLERDKRTKKIVRDKIVIIYNNDLQKYIQGLKFLNEQYRTHHLNNYEMAYNPDYKKKEVNRFDKSLYIPPVKGLSIAQLSLFD